MRVRESFPAPHPLNPLKTKSSSSLWLVNLSQCIMYGWNIAMARVHVLPEFPHPCPLVQVVRAGNDEQLLESCEFQNAKTVDFSSKCPVDSARNPDNILDLTSRQGTVIWRRLLYSALTHSRLSFPQFLAYLASDTRPFLSRHVLVQILATLKPGNLVSALVTPCAVAHADPGSRADPSLLAYVAAGAQVCKNGRRCCNVMFQLCSGGTSLGYVCVVADARARRARVGRLTGCACATYTSSGPDRHVVVPRVFCSCVFYLVTTEMSTEGGGLACISVQLKIESLFAERRVMVRMHARMHQLQLRCGASVRSEMQQDTVRRFHHSLTCRAEHNLQLRVIANVMFHPTASNDVGCSSNVLL